MLHSHHYNTWKYATFSTSRETYYRRESRTRRPDVREWISSRVCGFLSAVFVVPLSVHQAKRSGIMRRMWSYAFVSRDVSEKSEMHDAMHRHTYITKMYRDRGIIIFWA